MLSAPRGEVRRRQTPAMSTDRTATRMIKMVVVRAVRTTKMFLAFVVELAPRVDGLELSGVDDVLKCRS